MDFVHSGTDEHMRELVHDAADLATWLAIVTDAPTIRVRRGDLERAKQLREAIRLTALDVVAGVALRAEHLTVINTCAEQAPLVPALSSTGEIRLQSGTAVQALSSIARDAIDLFAAELDPQRAAADRQSAARPCRLRVCAADDCGLFILDTSRPNNRRWCSMELCGNRSKIRAYRARAGD
ncbi:MAG: zf-CGNR multi-domain protein [Ilumatobacteraceae bacterium]|nr:zf-CGNR multi-domain protein [Ilumatobacteraceae bacterium]MCU1386874.1 zf-CGNR multi-domain protein [Ilumatobacteraceae bacterium]